ncbi:MAG: histidine phosphatase family protein [Actinobacteria bacterium]|nr:histidine phosphatase family protein [Actinomycetota bacterium]
MPTLLVLRHAQAQPFAARDHDRALTVDGVAAARAAGRVVALTGVPDLVLLSTARRARQTVEAAMETGDWHPAIRPLDALYGGDPTEVLAALAAHGADHRSVLVVGHEPWCSGVVGLLTGARAQLTTAALASMQVGPGWDALDPAWCTLQWLTPSWLTTQITAAAR